MSQLLGGITNTINNNAKTISNSINPNNSVTTNDLKSRVISIVYAVFADIGKVINKGWHAVKRAVLPTIIITIVVILAMKYGVFDNTPGLKALAQVYINLIDAIAELLCRLLSKLLQGPLVEIGDIMFPPVG